MLSPRGWDRRAAVTHDALREIDLSRVDHARAGIMNGPVCFQHGPTIGTPPLVRADAQGQHMDAGSTKGAYHGAYHDLPLGIGTNKWRRADRGAVLETYRTIHDAGPCMIDTAEIYFSERVVGDCLRAGPTRAVIASKFLPFPGRTSPRRLMSALDGFARAPGPQDNRSLLCSLSAALDRRGSVRRRSRRSGEVRQGTRGRRGKFQCGPDAPHRRSPRKGRRSARRQSGQLQPAPTSSGNKWRARKPAVSSMWHWSRIFPLRPAASRSRRTAWARKRC